MSHLDEEDMNKRCDIQNRLCKLYDNEARGAMIRAKIQEADEIEHNVKYFKNIEIAKQQKQVIDCLIDDNGKETNNQNDILKLIGDFYKQLYTSSHIEQNDIDQVLDNLNLDNVLSDSDRDLMNKIPTLEEFDDIVDIPKENKSPGLDGLPIEFYRKFWSLIKNLYFAMILESWENKILPLSTRTSILSTLFKAENRKKLVNYRPLSLTNSDYKLVALLFAKRLEKILHKIISSDQSAYIEGRYIGTSIRNIIDLHEYCEKNNQPGAFICADFLKAFDSLEYNFILSVLERFNFGDTCISWMYNDVRFKVKNNGWVSESYSKCRGTVHYAIM